MKRPSFRSALAFGLAVSVITTFGASAAIASTAHKKKALSQTSIAVDADGTSGVNGIFLLAVQKNLFKKYGLDLTWNNNSNGASAQFTAFLGGDAQFVNTGASTEVAGIQAGAPVRILGQAAKGDPQEIVISGAAAAAHNIPAENGPFSNVAQTQKQVLALKGAHITVATSTITSNSYVWFSALARRLGLTVALNGQPSNYDLNITTAGSVPNEIAAFQGGKVDGFMNIPPNTTSQAPGSVVIPFANLAPLTQVIGNWYVTTIAEIQAHPDTVQAFMNAIVAAQQYLVQQPKKAKAAIEQIYGQSVVSSQLDTLYRTNVNTWTQAYPSLSGFNQSLAVFDVTLKTPFTVPYHTCVDAIFAKASYKLFHLKIPR